MELQTSQDMVVIVMIKYVTFVSLGVDLVVHLQVKSLLFFRVIKHSDISQVEPVDSHSELDSRQIRLLMQAL